MKAVIDAHLLYSCDVVHCQLLQRALQLLVISRCRLVNDLFLPAGRSLRKEQVFVKRKKKKKKQDETVD